MLNNKIIKLAIVCAFSLAGTSIASASSNPGFYVGGQLGVGDTHLEANNLPGTPSVNAMVNSFTNYGWNSWTKATHSDSFGLAGRIFAGYQFTPNWAAELGYTKFTNADIHGSYVGNGTSSNPNITGGYSYRGVMQEDAIDLVGKGILPLRDGFSLFGKLGVAYVQQDLVRNDVESVTVNGVSGGSEGQRYAKAINRFMPTFGAGVSYDITPQVPIDLSWMHIQKVGNEFGNADLVALGIAYKFS